jgi:hypothetical protein
VSERPRPEYTLVPHRIGGFDLIADLTTTVAGSDNVFATDTDQKSDLIGVLSPHAELRSHWSTHQIRAFAQANISRYSRYKTESTDDYTIGASGRLDLGQLQTVNLAVQHSHQTEPRTASTSNSDLTSPVPFTIDDADLQWSREVNRFRFSVDAAHESLNYTNATLTTGESFQQDYRDHKVDTIRARFDLAISPSAAVFVQVSPSRAEYDKRASDGFNRDSTTIQAFVGTDFEAALFRGALSGGFLQRQFRDPRISTIEGFGGDARLEWFPSPITTVTLNAARTVEDAGIVGATAYTTESISGRVDHELLRNLLLFLQGGGERDSYQGLDRRDRRTNIGVGATYLLNPRVGLTVQYSRLSNKSYGLSAATSYDAQRVEVAAVLHY